MTEIVTGPSLHRLLDVSLRPVIRAIGLTLGPEGRTVLYEHGPRDVAEAATGFVVSREMPIPRDVRGVAPRLLKETLFAADRDFGDGTARLALIAGRCFSAGAREIAGGVALRPLCESMVGVSGKVTACLTEAQTPVVDLLAVARSAGVTPALAEELAALVRELGPDASIDVKENTSRGIEVTKAQGFVLEAKPIAHEALTELSSPSVLVADEIIHDFGSLAAVLEGFANKRKPLVIVARDITDAALATLKRNQKAEIVTVAALLLAETGQRAADSLEDLAIATGATLIAERFGVKLESLRPSMLGQTAGFRFADGKAMFIEPKGKAEDIALRRSLLAAEAQKARYLSYDRELSERRRRRLGGQWCELRIAGDTPRATAGFITDARAALRSMQSALRQGAVQGGGALYGEIAVRLQAETGGEIERMAANAVAQGLLAIPRHLAANAGALEGRMRHGYGPVQDPLALTKNIVDQGVALAVALLRTGAVIVR
jgi:chaperonin GroEL